MPDSQQGQSEHVCEDCGTELTKVRGRRVGTVLWWCWKCEKYVRRPK
jgi:ribosomal protein L37AE/L43A